MITERENLVDRLVSEMHLSVPERAALSPKYLRYSEVAAVVARILNKTGFFPPNARPWREGNVVHEGAILEKLSNRRFRLTLQRSHPTAPHMLAAKKERDYMLARTAIRVFVRSEWPNGIDGIPIKRDGLLGIWQMKSEPKVRYVNREEIAEGVRKQFAPEYAKFLLVQMGYSPQVCPRCGNTSFTTLWLADPRMQL